MNKPLRILAFSILITLINAQAGCLAAPPTTSAPAPTVLREATDTPEIALSSTASFTLATLTPTAAPLHPSAGTIAFLSDRDGNVEIYAMHADGSDQTNLTNNFNNDLTMAWSPDGTKLVYESFSWATTTINLYLLNLQDRKTTQLTNTSYNNGYPAWSPDGKWIAFQAYPQKEAEIFMTNSEGESPIDLTNAPAVGDLYPAWSPDGAKIAFVTNRNDWSDIYLMNKDGSNLTNMTVHIDDANFPAWSPDGTKIAFQSLSFRDNKNSIYVINSDGTGYTKLATDTLYEFAPAWSPDGSKIAFVTLVDGNTEVYVMDADGSNQVNLTNHSSDDRSPAWSPDGKKIAFSSSRDGNAEIYAMNADGSELTNITRNPANDHTPIWSPAPINSAVLFECGTGWSRLGIGKYASVTEENNTPNRVRSGPSQYDELITQIYAGTPLKIIEGPICADGLVFWRVEHSSIPGGAGWTAEGDGNEYWLEPYTP